MTERSRFVPIVPLPSTAYSTHWILTKIQAFGVDLAKTSVGRSSVGQLEHAEHLEAREQMVLPAGQDMAGDLPIAVIGAGGHALSVLDAAASGGFEPVAFVDPLKVGILCGLPVVASVSDLDDTVADLALGIGANFLRQVEYERLIDAAPKYRFPAIIHRSAWVSPTASIGAGAVVLSMASVGANCVVGIGAVMNTSSSLDHSSQILGFSSLGPGAHTGGEVRIGERTMVGLNAGIFPRLIVGNDSVVGAHSMLKEDLGGHSVSFGVPATVTRRRATNEPYF